MSEVQFIVTKRVKCDKCAESIFKHGRCGCRKGWIESDIELSQAIYECCPNIAIIEVAEGDARVDEGNE